eukprot:CAMPEP_0195520530 /NCGR_PEP_ID=MMETSP0794_2-20130614/17109_1 /TAXON_ID=515487 /ORGANISM="Stephanopyxis turris, Strain CCMP 815" /LENGTH=127 /DNA_ID=CAMNT_0040649911 /DNA_START=119 /DNA_END=502 /DNA_ORIENTATION=-
MSSASSIPNVALALIGLICTIKSPSVHGFGVTPPSFKSNQSVRSTHLKAIEQIEFKIFPDGRIEETVRGVKGDNCHKITDEINQALGEVVATSPTEEMYENEVVVAQTLEVQDGGSGSGGDWGSNSW